MTEEKYTVRNGKCWIRCEKVETGDGIWNFSFPEALSMVEIADEIEKKFKDEPEKFKVIKFKYGSKAITVDSAQLNGKRIYTNIKEQVVMC